MLVVIHKLSLAKDHVTSLQESPTWKGSGWLGQECGFCGLSAPSRAPSAPAHQRSAHLKPVAKFSESLCHPVSTLQFAHSPQTLPLGLRVRGGPEPLSSHRSPESSHSTGSTRRPASPVQRLRTAGPVQCGVSASGSTLTPRLLPPQVSVSAGEQDGQGVACSYALSSLPSDLRTQPGWLGTETLTAWPQDS